MPVSERVANWDGRSAGSATAPSWSGFTIDQIGDWPIGCVVPTPALAKLRSGAHYGLKSECRAESDGRRKWFNYRI
jgi:hypothetical protein